MCSGSPDGSATTGANGQAVCNISLGDLIAAALHGYTAVYTDNPPYFGSRGDAGLL
jgi:hypothetical protein